MPGFRDISFANRSWQRWLPFLVCTLALYLSTPWVRRLNDQLVKLIGPWAVLWLALGLAGLGLCWAAAWLVFSRPNGLLGRWIGLAAVAVGSCLFLLYTRAVPAETIHLVEYGFLAWPALLAVSKGPAGLRTYLLAWALVALAGIGDEFFQWLLPNRVGEWRDAAMNAAAGGLGLVFMGLVMRLRHIGRES